MSDPTISVTGTELGLVKWLGGVMFSALGVLLGLVWRQHEKDIANLEAGVKDLEKTKADKADTEKRLDRGSEKFDEVIDLLREVKDGQTAMNNHLVAELASRPTREEVRTMLQQSGRTGP